MDKAESKYLAKFKNTNKKLNGSRLLVEVLPPKEIKSAGGLVLSSNSDTHKATADSYRAVLAVVLMVGEGYVDEAGAAMEMETKVGDIVMLNDFGMRYYSQFPGLDDYTKNKIAMTTESEVQLKFSGAEEFLSFEQTLNTAGANP